MSRCNSSGFVSTRQLCQQLSKPNLAGSFDANALQGFIVLRGKLPGWLCHKPWYRCLLFWMHVQQILVFGSAPGAPSHSDVMMCLDRFWHEQASSKDSGCVPDLDSFVISSSDKQLAVCREVDAPHCACVSLQH